MNESEEKKVHEEKTAIENKEEILKEDGALENKEEDQMIKVKDLMVDGDLISESESMDAMKGESVLKSDSHIKDPEVSESEKVEVSEEPIEESMHAVEEAKAESKKEEGGGKRLKLKKQI
ncbi:hypothetical protein CEXT_753191 [Caerostris extrusa]|uniref:Uncharacterized protein n=1 Tax=Caerostris extrusa TaxID=172846 RepID=A0AAV4W489_CAEEX|nr:hypothetical protein CEXT_753191 [Caerostris extrusa]